MQQYNIKINSTAYYSNANSEGKMLTYEILQRTSLLPITIVPTA